MFGNPSFYILNQIISFYNFDQSHTLQCLSLLFLTLCVSTLTSLFDSSILIYFISIITTILYILSYRISRSKYFSQGFLKAFLIGMRSSSTVLPNSIIVASWFQATLLTFQPFHSFNNLWLFPQTNFRFSSNRSTSWKE